MCEKICKNCACWHEIYSPQNHGWCDNEHLRGYGGLFLRAEGHAYLFTGAAFGCIHHEPVFPELTKKENEQ